MKSSHYGLLLALGILALSALQIAPAMGLMEPSEQLRAALGAARLGLGLGLLTLLARESGVAISKVILYGLPLAVVVFAGFWLLLPNPGAVHLQALPAGEQTYADLCLDCHGPMGVGDYGPALDDPIWLSGSGSRADLSSALQRAHSLPFDQLIAVQEQEALLDYLLSLQQH